jgi:hypothetical protein
MTINDPRDDPNYQVGGDKFKPQFDRSIPGVADPKTVNKFHEKDDLDSSDDAHHHTLGPKHNQSAAGDHNHNGTNSVQLLKGTTITGAKGGNVALASVIAALVKLGATDSTTA